MLSLGFGPQTEPHGIVRQREQGRGLRHIRRLRRPQPHLKFPKMQKYRLETRGRPQIRGCDIAQPNENSNRLQSQFTDTEIYALGYCGYSTAVFVLLHAGLIKQEVVRDREALQTQFANIMDRLLKPLPPDPMGKASGVRRFKILGSSHSRQCPSGVLQRNCSFQSASICRALAAFGERTCPKLCPLLYPLAVFF